MYLQAQANPLTISFVTVFLLCLFSDQDYQGRRILRKGFKRSETDQATVLSTVTTSPVYYQTFHVSNFRRNFRVAMPLKPDRGAPEPEQPPPASLENQVELQLAKRTRAADARTTTVLNLPRSSQPGCRLLNGFDTYKAMILKLKLNLLPCHDHLSQNRT
jgi:hypothetical protein